MDRFVAYHGVDGGTHQQRFDELSQQGLTLTLVAATGPVETAVFAAVFEQRDVGPWFARHGLTGGDGADSIGAENQRAQDQGFIPRCLSVYGTPGNRRFAGVWWQNTAGNPWAWWLADPNFHQTVFDAEVVGGNRPFALSVADDGWLLSVFGNDQVGPWTARHGLTAAGYQGAFDGELAQGRRPVVVAAGGAGANARYAAAFAATDRPIARTWTVTGSASPAGPALDTRIDAAMRDTMTAYGVRAGTLAIARAGQVRAARGYTWAEPGYPTTQPTTTFRLASVSKIFATAAALALADDHVLPLDTALFPYLGVTIPLPAGAAVDTRIGQVTVRQVLNRTTGITRDFGQDTTVNPARNRTFRDVALAAGRPGPPTLDDVVRYVYGLPLESDPGTTATYSNAAFHVLTAAIQKAAGQPIATYIRRRLLPPRRVNDLYTASTAAGARRPGEVTTYIAAGASPSQLDTSAGAMAADAYGGALLTEVAPGAGGLATSASTVARFIGAHAVWDSGPRAPGTRYGDFAGTATAAHSRPDGIDYCFLFNFWVPDPVKDALIARLDALLDPFASRF